MLYYARWCQRSFSNSLLFSKICNFAFFFFLCCDLSYLLTYTQDPAPVSMWVFSSMPFQQHEQGLAQRTVPAAAGTLRLGYWKTKEECLFVCLFVFVQSITPNCWVSFVVSRTKWIPPLHSGWVLGWGNGFQSQAQSQLPCSFSKCSWDKDSSSLLSSKLPFGSATFQVCSEPSFFLLK